MSTLLAHSKNKGLMINGRVGIWSPAKGVYLYIDVGIDVGIIKIQLPHVFTRCVVLSL